MNLVISELSYMVSAADSLRYLLNILSALNVFLTLLNILLPLVGR